MMRRLAACLLLVGCGADPTNKSATSDTPGTTHSPGEDTPLPGVSDPEAGTVPDAPEAISHRRQKKRMTVAQVRDSMERITGGIVWGDGDGDDSDWDTYAATLGVADYQTRTTSDLTPSVLFQKFLDDAAAHTCAQWLEAPDSTFFEAGDPESTDRSIVQANVVGLRWQVQGRSRAEEAPVIDDYVDLFATVYRRSGTTTEAWHTVCVAMFTHPDFFMY